MKRDKKQSRSKEEAKRLSDIEQARRYDPGKAGILGCDGYFEPENRQPHGPMRPGKTYQDRMPKERRPRVVAWQKRSERGKK